MDFHRKTLRALNRPGAARTVEEEVLLRPALPELLREHGLRARARGRRARRLDGAIVRAAELVHARRASSLMSSMPFASASSSSNVSSASAICCCISARGSSDLLTGSPPDVDFSSCSAFVCLALRAASSALAALAASASPSPAASPPPSEYCERRAAPGWRSSGAAGRAGAAGEGRALCALRASRTSPARRGCGGR